MREIVELYQAQEFHALYKRAMAESKKQAMDAKERTPTENLIAKQHQTGKARFNPAFCFVALVIGY